MSAPRSSSSNHSVCTPTVSASTTGRLVGQLPPNLVNIKDQVLIVLDHRYGENILSVIRLTYM